MESWVILQGRMWLCKCFGLWIYGLEETLLSLPLKVLQINLISCQNSPISCLVFSLCDSPALLMALHAFLQIHKERYCYKTQLLICTCDCVGSLSAKLGEILHERSELWEHGYEGWRLSDPAFQADSEFTCPCYSAFSKHNIDLRQ